MTDREKTVMALTECSFPTWIGYAVEKLQKRGVALDHLTDVLTEMVNETIKPEGSNATS
jgi:hypothetical protein